MFTTVLSTVVLLLATVKLSNSIETVDRGGGGVFEVDYEHDRFLKDGEPFRYISGSLHYFRIPRPYWRDRLRKCRAAGLNTICTYIEWSLHETSPGQFDFSGQNDIEYFIQLAKEEGLLVILRPGPYICAERDLGGYPPWLLHENPKMRLRTNDSSHTKHVGSWLRHLFPILQPHLYGNGGPVIMLQVENEYGSFEACDRDYTLWLRDLFLEYVGDKAVLFTTDGSDKGYLKCGPIPGVFITVDFGPGENVTKAFEALWEIQKHGPLVNSEFYPGWLTHWGEAGIAKVSTEVIVNSTRELLLANVSFNFYVFHGGSNFGFSSGANPRFQPQITSYDYDAPISESGNLTEKYYAIRSVISEFVSLNEIPVSNCTTRDYGTITLKSGVSLWDSGIGIDYGRFLYPQTMESLQLYSGLMLYETLLPAEYTGRGHLRAHSLHDRAIVYLNREPVGVLNRTDKTISIVITGECQTLGLLVENQGHINYKNMSDLKGLFGNVTLNEDVLSGWHHTGYPLKNYPSMTFQAAVEEVRPPSFYFATFLIPENDTPQDTFLDMTGWGKGVVYVNGFNLGRYWPLEGPQTWLYLPAPVLSHENTLLLLELEAARPDSTVRLLDKPPATAGLQRSVLGRHQAQWQQPLLEPHISVQMMNST